MDEHKNNIVASYDKKLVNEEDIEKIINEVRIKNLQGINVTVPFKKSVIPLDELSQESKETQSVNTILLEKNKIDWTQYRYCWI